LRRRHPLLPLFPYTTLFRSIREALQQVLEYEAIEVQTCPSGGEALRLYAEFRPDLVFLDVKMQGMDGLETLRKLRELDAHAQVRSEEHTSELQSRSDLVCRL